jgi:protein-S-isoprenylcysteine O-methyltransferase Ste14
MISRLVRTILILPGTVLVVAPSLIIWLTRDSAFAAQPAGVADLRFWIGVLLFCVGLAFASWTCHLFVTVGEGTPAPWDPPQKLVVRGPYQHVRNPMITSVLLMLAGEAVFLQFWVLSGWLLVFFLANAIYFPLSEEKGLERRFGDQYRLYKANVPRWIPRLRPWRPAQPPRQPDQD